MKASERFMILATRCINIYITEGMNNYIAERMIQIVRAAATANLIDFRCHGKKPALEQLQWKIREAILIQLNHEVSTRNLGTISLFHMMRELPTSYILELISDFTNMVDEWTDQNWDYV